MGLSTTTNGKVATRALVPFRTVTGRQSFYVDREMMFEWGDAMSIYKPILDFKPLKNPLGRTKEITLKFLTPHNKWSTHSMYYLGFREAPYVRLQVDCGNYFDSDFMRRTSQSRQMGKVSRVLLQGYQYSSGNVVKKTIVELG